MTSEKSFGFSKVLLVSKFQAKLLNSSFTTCSKEWKTLSFVRWPSHCTNQPEQTHGNFRGFLLHSTTNINSAIPYGSANGGKYRSNFSDIEAIRMECNQTAEKPTASRNLRSSTSRQAFIVIWDCFLFAPCIFLFLQQQLSSTQPKKFRRQLYNYPFFCGSKNIEVLSVKNKTKLQQQLDFIISRPVRSFHL